MATPPFIDIIQAKNNRLESVPSALLGTLDKTEKQVVNGILELISQLEVKGGMFVQSASNLRLAALITAQLKDVLIQSDYTKAVAQFASEFDIQAEINLKYFSEAFGVQNASEIVITAVNIAKRNAIDLLVNRAADAEFIAPIKNIIEQSVVNNASFSDTVTAIREFVEGTPTADGRLLRYTTQVSRDTFAIADASVSKLYSDEIGADWFYYSGGLIDSSRPFCVERSGRYFHRTEIEMWGAGVRTTGMSLPNSKGAWGGEILGTSTANIFSYRGGYNCGHSIMPVSVFAVPPFVIERNIAQGFYTPSDKELDLVIN